MKVDPHIRENSSSASYRAMTGIAPRWRCRKIVHHFVMFHGYRSARGRVASHSVQPARNGAYHEGRVGIIPGGQVGRGTAYR